MAVPVLVDTDIGDDIDDALALALAVASPECALVTVTTVFQRARLRAHLAQHLLHALGRSDVPVVPGADRPLLGTVSADWSPNQAGVLAGVPEPPAGHERAVERMIAEGLARPDLVVVPIGAMTNLALALAVAPELAQRIRVVAMAGAFDRPTAEWNVLCDPEAVAMVLASGVAIDFVGLDVTSRVPMRDADIVALAAGEGDGQRMLMRFVRAWQHADGRDETVPPLLHDPLALAAAMAPDLLVWEETGVTVELAPGRTRGVTTTGRRGSGRVRVAREADVDRFLDLFGRRVCGR